MPQRAGLNTTFPNSVSRVLKSDTRLTLRLYRLRPRIAGL